MYRDKRDMKNELQEIIVQQDSWINGRPAIVAVDMTHADHLSTRIAREVLEVRDEHNREEDEFDLEKLHLELADIFVYIASFCKVRGIHADTQQMTKSVNRQRRDSPVYDKMLEIAWNLDSNGRIMDVHTLFTLALSLGVHSSQPINVPHVMERVTRKNTLNRPAQYYSAHGLKGELLTREQLILRYYHSEAALRLIRDHYGSNLEPWMHMPFANLILDFEGDATNIAKLCAALKDEENATAQMVMSVLRSKTPSFAEHMFNNAPPSRFYRGLLLNGAVPLEM